MDEKWLENTNLVVEGMNSNYVTRKLRHEGQIAFPAEVNLMVNIALESSLRQTAKVR